MEPMDPQQFHLGKGREKRKVFVHFCLNVFVMSLYYDCNPEYYLYIVK